MQDLVEILSVSKLFKGVEKSDINLFVEELNNCKKIYPKKSILFSEGDIVENLFFLISGELEIVKYSYSGQKSIVANLKSGDYFAEAIAFSKSKTSPVTVEALSKCEVFFISKDELFKNSIEDEWRKRVLLNLLEISFEKSFTLNKKIEVLSQRTIKDKLLTYLEFERRIAKSNIIKLKHTKQALANYLEVDRTALFRVMKQLEEDGLITVNNKTIVLNNEVNYG